MPVEPGQAKEGPESDGTGRELTVTLYNAGEADEQPAGFTQDTETVCGPAVFHVTVNVLLAGVPPEVIVPPAETVQE